MQVEEAYLIDPQLDASEMTRLMTASSLAGKSKA